MKHPKHYDTTPEVSRRMSRVRLKRGAAETALAKALWRAGYRYRLNDRRLPGSPDIAISRYRIAVFVDGEFWHGYDWARRKERLKSNREYWIEKIQENIARDRRNDLLLQQAGWSPIHFWEKEVKKDLAGCVAAVEDLILERIVADRAPEEGETAADLL
ncbi:very short patch repair endonuclease [bacterium 1xD42-67]|nr:very short patch repair endonuclease [bacterium 1xD42-67]